MACKLPGISCTIYECTSYERIWHVTSYPGGRKHRHTHSDYRYNTYVCISITQALPGKVYYPVPRKAKVINLRKRLYNLQESCGLVVLNVCNAPIIWERCTHTTQAHLSIICDGYLQLNNNKKQGTAFV